LATVKKNNFIFQEYSALTRIARKVREDDFWLAESYAARDRLCRMLAGEAYALAERFKDQREDKLSLQYAKLAAKLLGLSLRPKKLSDLEEIKRALARLKEQKDAAVV
jgi:hypothetical protein